MGLISTVTMRVMTAMKASRMRRLAEVAEADSRRLRLQAEAEAERAEGLLRRRR